MIDSRMGVWSRPLWVGVLAVVFAAAGLAAVMPSAAATSAPPTSDPFYQPPPALPAGSPGTIIRTRPVTITGLGVPLPLKAWQIMFVSTDVGGTRVAGVTTLIEPLFAPSGQIRLISYQEPWDSDSLDCAPSYEVRLGQDPNELAFVPALLAGYAVAVPDFEGLDAEFTVGVQAAHGVLDGVRAVEHFAPAALNGAATPVALWGYSGGAQASAWASELASTYAPEVHIIGVAAGGVPPDITDIAVHLDGGLFSGIELAGVVGMSRAYPRLLSLENARGKAMATKISEECIDQYAAVFAEQRLDTYTTVRGAIHLPWVQDILRQNQLGHHQPAAPTYIYQSLNDELIPGADVNRLVAEYCADGARVTYYQDAASEHISLAVTGAPAAFLFLVARFEGQPAPTTCGVPSLPPIT